MGNEKKNFKGKKRTRKTGMDTNLKSSSRRGAKFPKESEDTGKLAVWKDGPNDPIWRCSDKTMTSLVANLPFGLAAGIPQKIQVNATSTKVFAQPGILTIHTLLTMGESNDYNSALNLCSRKVYSFVRHANSGSKNYEAADLTIYFASIMQILGLLGWLQRLLAVIDKYSITNRYKPTVIIESMGVDYDDILSHQPQLKWLVAWLGRAVGSLAFPQLPIFQAAYEAFKYIIIDKTSPKPQLYMYNPYAFGEFSPTGEQTGSSLYYKCVDTYAAADGWKLPYSDTRMTYADLNQFAHHLMDVLLGDEDCGIMSGDILKAFAQSGLFVPQAFGEYDPYIESPEVLQQIHNLSILPISYGRLTKYTQNPGTANTAPFVKHELKTQDGTSAGGLTTINMAQHLVIDAFADEPQPEEVVNCTVMQVNFGLKEYTQSGSKRYCVDSDKIAFDLYLPCWITYGAYRVDSETGVGSLTISTLSNLHRATINTEFFGDDLEYLNFDWAPMVFGTNMSGNQLFVIGDIQNFRIWNFEISKRIHDNSMLSLLNFKELNFVR